MKKFILIAMILSGCTHMVPVQFDVETDPPGAMVESNGVAVCETPCTIELKCRKNRLTGATKPSSASITVVPKRNPASQMNKSFDACAASEQKQKIYFNMQMDQVTPVQRIEIKNR